MKAAVLVGKRQIDLTEVPRPSPGPGQVLILTRAVGICGTDLNLFRGEDSRATLPVITGHEAAGEVAEIGNGVEGLSEGDRVVVDPSFPCWNCTSCFKGQYYRCESGTTLGIDRDGAFAEYFVAPATSCHKLPTHVTWGEASLVDSLACTLHALQQQVTQLWGSTIAVLGPGPAGLAMVQLAKLQGAGKVVLVGRREGPLELGTEYGADVVVKSGSEEAVVQSVLAETGGMGVDLVFEACGQGSAIRQAIELVKKGGRILLYGSFAEPIDGVDFQKLRRKEASVLTSAGAPWTYDTAIDLISTGRVRVGEMITHQFGLNELDRALAVAESREGGYIKGVVCP